MRPIGRRPHFGRRAPSLGDDEPGSPLESAALFLEINAALLVARSVQLGTKKCSIWNTLPSGALARMQAKDDKSVALRRAVANRLKRIFDAWTAELAAGTASIWDGVQRRLSGKAPEVPPAAPRTGPQTVAHGGHEHGKAVSNDPRSKP